MSIKPHNQVRFIDTELIFLKKHYNFFFTLQKSGWGGQGLPGYKMSKM